MINNNYGTGYDAKTNTTPSLVRGDHGTVCAGIIGATGNNSEGVIGVAPKCELMSISTNLTFADTPQQLANGFSWAWQNGADIISNSWGGYAPSNIIETAIHEALTVGRNGKGTIIVFSSGNENNINIRYPGNINPQILVVGAISPCGERKSLSSCDNELWGSCYGDKLDIMAPGVLIPTTDRVGSFGLNPNHPSHLLLGGNLISSDYLNEDYTVWFHGTSAACPHVAAVCALVLSINPNLTGQQVRDIIESTAQKARTDLYNYNSVSGRNNGTWNNEMGYGLVDACNASLVAALGIQAFTNNSITTNTVLSTEVYITNDISIESGATLTITSKIRFGKDVKVKVKQGAKLIVDGGILTNMETCGNFWQGIEVWGTTDKNQYPANHPTHQGLLIVKNGGIIENAHHAVSNWRKDHWDQIGGVIQVTNGIFRNNRRDVEFMSYQNYTQTYSQKYRNLSYFTDVEFVSDDDFIEHNLPLQPHVSMWDVDGIVFKNCHFKNEITANKANSSAPRKGIFSLDAGYQILPNCTALSLPIGQSCPTAQLFKSSFSGLEVGIDASASSSTETITVQQTNFMDNIYGIIVNEMDHVSLTQNTFEIGNAGYSNNPYFGLGLGVKIDNSTGFKIEENTIESDLTSGLQVGVWVNNSGSDDNRVYKNDIQNVSIALHSSGKNHNANLQKGLQFLCNTLQDNTIAIGIGSSPTNDGVRLYQGDFSPSKSAGNTFISNDTDINNTANSIIYIHNGGNKEPNIYTGLVTLQTTTTANACPSSFGPPIMFEQYNSMIDSLGLVFSDLTDSYENLKYSYTTLIDNGNTETFKENIKLSWSADAWLLRSNLLDNSPYLSSEVLLKSAEQNVLPNGMLLEILLANPDATKGEHFIEKLNEATQHNFPEYMQDYVRANYDLQTLRTEMEGQLASIHSNRADVKDWITYLIKSKDEYQTIDRLNVINLGQELYSKVGLIDYYVSENHFSQADSVLQAVQIDKKYQDELSLIDNLEDYLNFRSDVTNRNLAQLDSSEISYLQDLAQGTSRASGYAKNILCYFYDICFEPELALLNTENKMLPTPTKNTKDLANALYDFKIFPNPAKEYVSITWEIFDNLVETTYSITDLSGKTHLQGSINSNKGEQQIDTRMLKEGLYILNIHNNNQNKTSKKLIIINQVD